jgi:hypothetical protein
MKDGTEAERRNNYSKLYQWGISMRNDLGLKTMHPVFSSLPLPHILTFQGPFFQTNILRK